MKSKNDIEIRIATPQDAPDIASFFVDIRRDSVSSIHSTESVAQYISTALISRGSSYVLIHEGQIEAWLDVHDGWVDQLYCRRDSTGKGYGKLLLDFAKSLSPNGLKLYTFQVNQGARRFYAREGFIEKALSAGTENEEQEPDVLLEFGPGL